MEKITRVICLKKDEEDLLTISDIAETSTTELFTKGGKMSEPINSILRNFIQKMKPGDKIEIEMPDKS